MDLFKWRWSCWSWGSRWATGQGTALDVLQLSRTRQSSAARCTGDLTLDPVRGFLSAFKHGLVLLSRVVVSHFNSNISCIFSTALQWVPVVVLASTRNDQVVQVDPGLTDHVGLLIVIEYRDLQFEVIWGFVHGKSELRVPKQSCKPTSPPRFVALAYHRGVCPPRRSVCVFFASLPNLAAQ
jgi:hypothetical protein